MDSSQNTALKTLQAPDWSQVRSVYKKLSDEFHVLTSAFEVELPEETKVCLDHLITVIDEVDSCIDELPTKEARDSITTSLIAYLQNEKEQWQHPHAPQSLRDKIKVIKWIVRKTDIEKEFIHAARLIFHYTEIKRHTKDLNQLLKYIQEEGKATALLPLSILKMNSNIPFGVFFTKLCTLMGIVDLIFDAQEDYKKGFIIAKPTVTLYAKLIKIMIVDGVKLLISFPGTFRFLTYCTRFTWALMKE